MKNMRNAVLVTILALCFIPTSVSSAEQNQIPTKLVFDALAQTALIKFDALERRYPRDDVSPFPIVSAKYKSKPADDVLNVYEVYEEFKGIVREEGVYIYYYEKIVFIPNSNIRSFELKHDSNVEGLLMVLHLLNREKVDLS